VDDLVQWLRAQLDEDERIARAVEDRSAPWDGQWVADGDNAARTFNGHVLFYGHSGPLKPGLVAHVVEHDPARVLREIDAKRKRLAALAEAIAAGHDSYDLASELLPLEALPYADRPGYRDDWRP
jgi:hypothetical protein